MSEENIKHSSEAAILKQIDHAEKINMKLFKNMRIIAKLTRLGVTARLAEQAYMTILEKGIFTSQDCTRFGALDTTQKKRVFTVLKANNPHVKIDLKTQYNDRRKTYVAWIDDKKLEEMQKGPDQEIKDFVQQNSPTRNQLIEHFEWGENGAKRVGELVHLKKIAIDQITHKVSWIKD